MASFSLTTSLIQILLVLFTSATISLGARPRILELWVPDTDLLTYHNGAVLQGNIPVSVVWYGHFTSTQKSIVTDFLHSLTSNLQASTPSVGQWWSTIDQLYLSNVGNHGQQTQVHLDNQVSDDSCSMGKHLTMSQVSQLAAKAGHQQGAITLFLTAEDVEVEGFCMNRCGFHASDQSTKSTYIWVGNSATQCPGQCAWPFHQPVYGPQNPPLGAPNGDVGMDGMVINIASMIAGTVTNPFGDGYFQGSKEAPLEAATACLGVYGKGAYPGYAGELHMDPTDGCSYNANGANGRKYLLPALFDPSSSTCSTLV
jgi:Phosphate-induced protein 1 conserved region